MLPEAPSRLSTITDWPQRSVSFCAKRRPMMSVPPPGAKPATSRTGLVGYGCAQLALAASKTSSTKNLRIAVS